MGSIRLAPAEVVAVGKRNRLTPLEAELLRAVKAYMFIEQTASGVNPHPVGSNRSRAFELGRAAIAKAESK